MHDRTPTQTMICVTPACWMEGQPWAPAGGWATSTPRCECCGCRLEAAR